MKKDKVFSEKLTDVKAFEFNDGVAEVFDDMVSRSVPFYSEIHRIILDLVDKRLESNDLIYDLGCSTGTTIEIINRHVGDEHFRFVGIDNSPSMIKKCQEKWDATGVKNYQLICGDIDDLAMESCGMVIMNYTLQFIEKNKRMRLLEKIYNSLRPGGVFVLAEKIACNNDQMQELFTDLYYDFKRRNGYSELEISQKREALENVLVPLTPKQQLSLLELAGFSKADMAFKWYNFASFIGIK